MRETLHEITETISGEMILMEELRDKTKNRLRVSNSRKIRIFSETVKEMHQMHIITAPEKERLLFYNEQFKQNINEPLKKRFDNRPINRKKKCEKDGCDRRAKRGMNYCSATCSPLSLRYPDE